MVLLTLFVLTTLLLAASACNANDAEGPPTATDAGGGDASADATVADATVADAPPLDAGLAPDVGYPAPHPPLPPVLFGGGKKIVSPNLVAITFAGDPLAPSIAQFLSDFWADTAYWRATTAEYGVGPIQSLTSFTLPQPPASRLTQSQIESWLEGLTGGTLADADAGPDAAPPPLPPPDATGNTLYLVFYPPGVEVDIGSSLCAGPLGYHNAYYPLHGYLGVYAVVPRCPAGPNGSELDRVTAVAARELIDTVTDPFAAIANPTWYGVGDANQAWTALQGSSEIGVLCAPLAGSYMGDAGLPFLVTKAWSNAYAAVSKDPCEPAGMRPYFNAAPVVSDDLIVYTQRPQITTTGVFIPVGTTRTVEVDLFSDSPTPGPWTVRAVELDPSPPGAPHLSFAFDRNEGQNGDKLQLSVTVLSQGDLGPKGAELFWLESSLGGAATYWPVYVGN